ncbi:brown fat uncoupling protein 1 [Monoraphidium neglectum]|uniref:Brown fat uncoupling protein 1 n=1 Tax=Monoraphidium neglectum TaxID=145388 RepID=A0A0D2K9T1_9CHLO|nr:brown fat uncoupling protein 1 [Monoraphidium neglectum]KIZ07023.1 brown fat uncoupling protein 1 [Monoraphidium neglectum]|eukprot:XP_013906042.1 brown fat uncoupling protein 1 [Monoraphidium neglectum]
MQDRLGRALAQAAANKQPYGWVLLLGGTNDISSNTDAVDVLAALASMHDAIHAAGARLVAMTLPPFNTPLSSERVAAFDALNNGIRRRLANMTAALPPERHPRRHGRGLHGPRAALVDLEPLLPVQGIDPEAKVAASAGVVKEVVVSGISVSIANTATNPLDMIKTRMQLQPVGQRVNMFTTGAMVVRDEGVLALWKGLTPSLMRGMFFGGLRLGMYNPTKQWLADREAAASGGVPPSSVSMSTKVLAGTLSGTGAALVCSPTELLKTRMQAAAAGTSTMQVVRNVVRQDGLIGLYRGATPGVVRSGILTATQCATYDQAKRWIMSNMGWQDGLGTQLVTGLATGLVSTTITNPVDVVKTTMFTTGASSGGPVKTARVIYQRAGMKGFLRGWSASYMRLGPQTLVMFMAAEKLREMTGMDSL